MLRRVLVAFVLICSGLAVAETPFDVPRFDSPRTPLSFDYAQAEQVLAMLDARTHGREITDGDWSRLFETAPFPIIRFAPRDAQQDFSRAKFKEFVLSPELLKRADTLREALEISKHADTAKLTAIPQFRPRVFVTHARIVPIIAPKQRSFVVQTAQGPVVFIPLDIETARQHLEKTVASRAIFEAEVASMRDKSDEEITRLPWAEGTVSDLTKNFDGGLALLASISKVETHPYWAYTLEEREHWNRRVGEFDQDLKKLDAMFAGILSGQLRNQQQINDLAENYATEMGAWQTVGYSMAVMIERTYGSKALIGAMRDPRWLIGLYNRAVNTAHARTGADYPNWSPEVLRAVGLESTTGF